jgi:hypothetical protein
MSWIRGQALRALLGKVVLGISALVALADSAPEGRPLPIWSAEEQRQIQVVFAEQYERRALSSIELHGQLYADLSRAEVEVTATADRSASDLELSVRPLGPSPLEAARFEPPSEPEPNFRGGFDLGSAVPTARAHPMYPHLVSLAVPVECAEDDAAVPRAESCLEQLEITLTRESERPLSVELTVLVRIYAYADTEPEGTFEIHLEELAP